MGSSGGVAITAGFVFAITMLALLSSDVINIGQAGSTICVGLMFDMLGRASIPGDAARPAARPVVLVAPKDSESPQTRTGPSGCNLVMRGGVAHTLTT